MKVPDFVDVAPALDVPPSVPNVVVALNRLTTLAAEYDVRVVDLYDTLRNEIPVLSLTVPPLGHVDGGSAATTTDRQDYLFCYHPFTPEERSQAIRLKVADATIHVPTGTGYIKVPCDAPPGFLFLQCYFTPEIPATIISPDAAAKSYHCQGYSTFSDLSNGSSTMQLVNCGSCDGSVSFHLSTIRGLLFTEPLVMPTAAEHVATILPVPDDGFCSLPTLPRALPNVAPVRALTATQQRALWHCRLGHVNERLVSDLHHYVDGIPKLPRSDPISSCPLCKRAKLHKANRGPDELAEPTACWQDVQIDFGFMVQRSKSKTKKNMRATQTHTAASNRTARTVTELRSVESTATRRSARVNRFTGGYATSSSRARARAHSGFPSDPLETDPSPTPSPRYSPAPSPQLYSFEKIVAHQGPLAPNHKNYKGHPFNLKILWSTKETTWEPLHNFFADQPDSVIEYAQSKNLLNNPAWSMVRDLALNPDYQPGRDDDFHEEFDFVDSSVPTARDADDDVPLRYRRTLGLNGETCYVLITDRLSGGMRVSIRRDKSPPIDFLRSFITNYKPDVPGCRVRFDGGGELGGCTEIHQLFEEAGYEVEVTSPDSSSSIGLVERPHRSIADAVRTMLFAAGLPLKYWPYALVYYVLIHNCLPHGEREESAYTICTKRKFNVSLLRVFGCRCYALPTESRDVKLDVHARPGIFLGYRKSLRVALYIDAATGKVKTTRHITFDEGMLDSANPPPFAKFIANPEVPMDTMDLGEHEDLRISLSPFTSTVDVPCSFRPHDEHALGVQFDRCPRYRRVFATAFTRPFGPHSMDTANRRFIGSYVLKIGDHPVFTQDDILRIVHHYRHLPSPPATLSLRLATDQRRVLHDARPPALHLRPVDIRRISAMPLVAGEGTPAQQRASLRALSSTPVLPATPPDPDDVVPLSAAELVDMRKLSNDHMTDEEKALPSFTRKRLMTLSNWPEWRAADFKQLDQHYQAGTIGKAVPRPTKDPEKPSQVFRLHWARLVKSSGVRKSRACLDGSKRAAPWLRMLVQTYSSCIELPCLRAFLAICANRGYYVGFGDVENAYQQSPPPTVDCFLEIDDTIEDWYQERFKEKLDRLKSVIPLFRALQGHPEAGVLWERMITDILINKMGFKNTAHEKNLYFGYINGTEVLVCRQVDDFAAGSPTKQGSEEFITELRKHVEAEFAALGIETSGGMYQRYNGIDIFQTRDYIKVSAESYIDRMLQTHGWDAPKKPVAIPSKPVPLNPAIANHLMTLQGPPEKTTEARILANNAGFSYRNILGELIYAYVICRLDIGYAVCFLARFSDSPHEEHYSALKGVCKYLRATKSWGIMYVRPSPLMDLPYVPFEFLEPDSDLPSFPFIERDELVGLLDAAHATDLKTRRSVTGFVILFCRAAIAWKSRLQSLVATSSTEAEFYSAVTCAKVVKYLRNVLQELDALRQGPSRMFIDNEAALAMINEFRPTPRARHIDIQYFAIQEWRQRLDIVMKHLSGILNPSDDLTKPLGWILHSRHARRSMGHYRYGSPK